MKAVYFLYIVFVHQGYCCTSTSTHSYSLMHKNKHSRGRLSWENNTCTIQSTSSALALSFHCTKAFCWTLSQPSVYLVARIHVTRYLSFIWSHIWLHLRSASRLLQSFSDIMLSAEHHVNKYKTVMKVSTFKNKGKHGVQTSVGSIVTHAWFKYFHTC